MKGYEAIRDQLYSDPRAYKFLDAAQLIKHALGLRTAVNQGRPSDYPGKRPVLVYLRATPSIWPQPSQGLIPAQGHSKHAEEIWSFAKAVAGDEVEFYAFTYEELLNSWSSSASLALRDHVRALRERFLV
jgi:hypothetical protein